MKSETFNVPHQLTLEVVKASRLIHVHRTFDSIDQLVSSIEKLNAGIKAQAARDLEKAKDDEENSSKKDKPESKTKGKKEKETKA
jgi:hypothetical protein